MIEDEKQKKFINDVAQIIYDKKGFNILGIDVRKIHSMTDVCIIAEGNVERHVQAISRSIREELKKEATIIQVEGEISGDWIVLDYGDVVIHLLTPDMRERYELEGLWKGGKVVNFDINLDSSKEEERYE